MLCLVVEVSELVEQRLLELRMKKSLRQHWGQDDHHLGDWTTVVCWVSEEVLQVKQVERLKLV